MAILTRRVRRAALAAALLAGPVLLSGCLDLFKPATPEPPAGRGSITVRQSYTAPDTTLQTLADAMANKNQSNGADAWIGAFPTTADNVPVEFDFDAGVAQALGYQNPAWNLDEERSFYVSLSAENTNSYLLVWGHWLPGGNDEIDEVAGTAVLPRTYRLYTVVGGNPGATLALGIAQLTFQRVDNRWLIKKWVDTVDPSADPKDPGQVSFSFLRLSLVGPPK